MTFEEWWESTGRAELYQDEPVIEQVAEAAWDAQQAIIDAAPACKCGNVCEYYGEVGGYSVACKACNTKNAERQRKARARAKTKKAPFDA